MDEERLRGQMTMLERTIGTAFVQNSLPVHLCGGVQGPHTFTFALRLYEPTVANLSKALRLAPAIEAMTGTGPVRIYTQQGLLYVEMPAPWPVSVQAIALHGQGLAVPLGLTGRQAIAGVDFAQTPHLLVVGPTGRGKTTALRTIAFHLARQNPFRRLHLLVVTFKPDDWQAVRNLCQAIAVVNNPEEVAALLNWLVDIMHERTANGGCMPHLFVILDDLLNLLATADVVAPLVELASLGRAAGIHLLIGTQRLGKRGAGDAAITGNMPVRLVFGTADAQDASFFTGRGESGAESLGRYAGDALLVSDGGTVRLAVASVGDRDLTALPQAPVLSRRPWQRTAPTGIPPAEEGSDSTADVAIPPSMTGIPVQPPLDYRMPSAEEKAWLRQLYAQLGSKNKTLAVAWGGVINASGKTPKTLAWLNAVLAERETVI